MDEPPVGLPSTEEVRGLLHEVIDPDLGVNVVDLGFVRDVAVEGPVVRLVMTLTSPACPLTGVMEDQIRAALVAGPVRDVRVEWVWSPAWTPDLITPDGREQLQAIGFRL
ncbi:protein of unknown function DUF59 [Pseudonocardia dioxanivorans CB1190]|uniref:MIP18 family-like domain-containing protein n=1 Tax=Pseudonocardia dioxanivorans (strain ATCC 55486 / DSM 44775 / JCM 13855 / CB1190) TaxID=675635 RepID=F4CQY3_PSEUX|nr:metal-sulfur cluster assembly factor [Pseudonocardia dioxanivorans]AEA23682.1 protein of unknown function DUF59 [Pseudonocardia dioxanivorans CB1190]